MYIYDFIGGGKGSPSTKRTKIVMSLRFSALSKYSNRAVICPNRANNVNNMCIHTAPN